MMGGKDRLLGRHDVVRGKTQARRTGCVLVTSRKSTYGAGNTDIGTRVLPPGGSATRTVTVIRPSDDRVSRIEIRYTGLHGVHAMMPPVTAIVLRLYPSIPLSL